MTFLDLTDDDTRDLALELFFAGDAPDLDSAAALAFDLSADLFAYSQEWDADAGYVLMPEGDLLDADGLRVV